MIELMKAIGTGVYNFFVDRTTYAYYDPKLKLWLKRSIVHRLFGVTIKTINLKLTINR